VINALSTTAARTPFGLKPGTQVTITGYGFCPGTQVEFGNPKATVTATVNSDGTRLTATTPRLATNGPIVVKSGGQIRDSTPLKVNNYRDQNGYSFLNYKPSITLAQMTEAFGTGQVYDNIDPCGAITLGVVNCTIESFPDPFALGLLEYANQEFGGSNGGACFGFSLSSQRFLEGYAHLSDFPPANASSIFGLQQSGALTEYINSQQISQLSTEFLSQWLNDSVDHGINGGAASSQEVYREIRSMLARGHFPLISLMDGSQGHVVVAYNVEGAPPNWYVDVYDSNEPYNYYGNEDNPNDGSFHQTAFDNSRIHIDSDGNWTLPSTGIQGSMTGFIVTDPSTLTVHPTLASPRAPIRFLFSSNSAPGGGSSAAGAGASTARSVVTQVSDAAGRTLLNAAGQLNSNPKTSLRGAFFAPMVGGARGREGSAPGTQSGSAAGQPPAILVPGGSGPLTEMISDTGRGPDTHAFVGEGMDATVTTMASEHVHNQLTVSSSRVAFRTDAKRQPVEIALNERVPGGAKETVDVRTTSGGTDVLALHGGHVSFSNNGPETTVRVRLSSLGRNALPSTFLSEPVHIGRGAHLKLSGIDWSSVERSRITLSSGRHRMKLRNTLRRPGVRLASVRVKARASRVSLIARRGGAALPKSAKVTFVVLVKRHGKVVVARSAARSSARRTARFSLGRLRPGRYSAVVYVLETKISGITENTGVASRKLSFKVPRR
jgi:hypothetical protein